MALPKLETPTYSLTLPSTGGEIKYRPFLIKEQKLMLIAQDTDDIKESYASLKQILNACTFSKIDIDNSPTFDIEYMFLRVRAKSVGSKIDVNVVCPDDNETRATVQVDLDEIEVQIDENHTNKVVISDEVTLIMKYPTLKDTAIVESDAPDFMVKMVISCIAEVHHGETIYASADMNNVEKKEFIESFSIDQFEKLNEFFETMPKIRHYVSVTNPKTEVESQVLIEGLDSFLV